MISNFMVTYENGPSNYDVLYAQWKLVIDNQILLCQQNYTLELRQLKDKEALQRQQLWRLNATNNAMMRL